MIMGSATYRPAIDPVTATPWALLEPQRRGRRWAGVRRVAVLGFVTGVWIALGLHAARPHHALTASTAPPSSNLTDERARALKCGPDSPSHAAPHRTTPSRRLAVELVLSINAHTNRERWLYAQLDHIEQYVRVPHVTVLHASNALHDQLTRDPEFGCRTSNVLLNPDHSDKKRYHGSILEGIFSNLRYALNDIDFRWFVVLSARTRFHRPFGPGVVARLRAGNYTRHEADWVPPEEFAPYKSTVLYQLLLNGSESGSSPLRESSSPHEGLLLSQEMGHAVHDFLAAHPEAAENLFEFEGAVEEFAVQTLLQSMGLGYHFVGMNDALRSFTAQAAMARGPGTLVHKVGYPWR